ncbi:protein CWP1 [Kluyveromyces marxianus]|uniref:Protein CWP1 n=1 Tax=Kluyveromyces marxianus TaxID=4911 RepID=A0ABX6EMT2_KLUMA|nr:protein CWP1 [Kluyveromyces marxianus]
MIFPLRYCSFLLAFFLRLITAASEDFTLKLSAAGTKVDGFNIYVDDQHRIVLSKSGQSMSGAIQDDGTLKLNNGETVGIGKNYLSTEALSSSFIIAEPWTIVGGKLKLYDGDFHSIYSGTDDIYVLGSKNAAMGRSDVIVVSIVPVDSNGNVIADFSATTSSSSAASSTAAKTSSFLSSTTSASISSNTVDGGIPSSSSTPSVSSFSSASPSESSISSISPSVTIASVTSSVPISTTLESSTSQKDLNSESFSYSNDFQTTSLKEGSSASESTTGHIATSISVSSSNQTTATVESLYSGAASHTRATLSLLFLLLGGFV